MCTVTFIPLPDGFLMSSNRDENPKRQASILPQLLVSENFQCLAPIDGAAGGTWMGLRNDGAVVILLNGAFTNHKRNTTYRKSRGLVVKELLQCQDLVEGFLQTDLRDIEPFSLIVFHREVLSRLVWDGEIKHHGELDSSRAHIWSSATLYDEKAQQIRHEAFYTGLGATPHPDANWLEQTLVEAMPEDQANRFVMRRGNHLATLSLAIIRGSSKQLTLKYLDLMAQPAQVYGYHLPLHTHYTSLAKHEQINLETLVH